MDCITTGYAIDGGLGLATNKGWMLNCAPLPVSLVVEHQDQQNHKDKHLHNSACAKMATGVAESLRRHRCKLDNKRQVKSPRYSLNNEQTSRPNKTIAGTHISQTKTCWTSDVPLTIPAPGIQRIRYSGFCLEAAADPARGESCPPGLLRRGYLPSRRLPFLSVFGHSIGNLILGRAADSTVSGI